MKHQTDCKHGTKITGQCAYCGEYPYDALPSILQSAESERQILRCAPPFDAQAEHENDLRYESRVDAESWQYDGPAEREDA